MRRKYNWRGFTGGRILRRIIKKAKVLLKDSIVVKELRNREQTNGREKNSSVRKCCCFCFCRYEKREKKERAIAASQVREKKRGKAEATTCASAAVVVVRVVLTILVLEFIKRFEVVDLKYMGREKAKAWEMKEWGKQKKKSGGEKRREKEKSTDDTRPKCAFAPTKHFLLVCVLGGRGRSFVV